MELIKADGAVLRSVMRRVPSPVTVVTAAGEEEARGVTIGSFTSVSLEPPLISFNVERRARMHEVLLGACHFAVHILGDKHAPLCNHFAKPDCSGMEQLEVVPHRLDAYGSPVLESALVVLSCRSYATFVAGDHSIFIGEVIEVEEREAGAVFLYLRPLLSECRRGSARLTQSHESTCRGDQVDSCEIIAWTKPS